MTTPSAALPPLNEGLFRPHKREQFVVFAYWPEPGWWRREGDYGSEAAAQRVADAHKGQGRAVIVARQVVTLGPIRAPGGPAAGTAREGRHRRSRRCAMSPDVAAVLAEDILAAMSRSNFAHRQEEHDAALRLAVASDLAGLRDHEPAYDDEGVDYLVCNWCGYHEAGGRLWEDDEKPWETGTWPCPDATRYATGLRRTAALYGVEVPRDDA